MSIPKPVKLVPSSSLLMFSWQIWDANLTDNYKIDTYFWQLISFEFILYLGVVSQICISDLPWKHQQTTRWRLSSRLWYRHYSVKAGVHPLRVATRTNFAFPSLVTSQPVCLTKFSHKNNHCAFAAGLSPVATVLSKIFQTLKFLRLCTGPTLERVDCHPSILRNGLISHGNVPINPGDGLVPPVPKNS